MRLPGTDLGRIVRVSELADETMSGYEVSTTTSAVSVLIDNRQQCCEEWGYVCSNDSLPAFVGAVLLGVEVTDENLCSVKIPKSDNPDHEMIAVFVTLDTDWGKLQFAVYNGHNGYYGHRVKVTLGDRTIHDGKI